MLNSLWRRRLILALIALCAVGLVVMMRGLHRTLPLAHIQGVSTITAALDRQVAARGESLEVVYSVAFRGSDPSTGELNSRPPIQAATVRYITTPTVCYTRVENQTAGVRTSIYSSFKDASASMWMMVTEQYSSGGAPDVRAAIGSRAMGISATLDLLDPLGVHLTGVTARDWLARGSLSPDTEQIDGHECYRVDARDGPNNCTQSIWIDPTIGCMPRRVAVIMSNGVPDCSIDYLGYKEVAQGVWYPWRAEITTRRGTNGRIDSMNYLTASKVSVGKKFTGTQLKPTIPSGATIYWRDTRTYTTQP